LYTTTELEVLIDAMADQAASWCRPLRLDVRVKRYADRYADDPTLLHPQTRLDESAQLAAVDVADDVLHSGHSMLKVVA
jgi:pyrimidine operon attenuation protein/uracil phosphoribosyltransferase